MELPKIIQGGMGIAVSNWKLANAVAKMNQMGVVSGTGIDTVLVRRLQDGDLEGDIKRALSKFPDQEVAQKIFNDFYIKNGKENDRPYKRLPLHSVELTIYQQQILAVASFVEVYLAKENHQGSVGINLLEKIQIPNLAIIYGAMLAQVDFVLMGAGIPREIPGALDLFAKNESASLKIDVLKSTREVRVSFDPKLVFPNLNIKELKRPKFLAIISSLTLASHLIKKATGNVDGFIIEGPLAGGHNAPPRGGMVLNELGSPIYTEKDEADLAGIAALGKPFWLAGTYGTPTKFQEAQALGASGIQVGTAFAFCEEAGFTSDIKKQVIAKWGREGERVDIFTDPSASPTGFPFKVAPLTNTLAEKSEFEARSRVCDLGYLREMAMDENGAVVYRCPAEPASEYVKKGGDESKTTNRKCLCNALMSAAGLAQVQKNNYFELPLVTAGDDVVNLFKIIHPLKETYSASDVINYLTGA